MVTTRPKRASKRTILCAPKTPEELRFGEVVGDHRRPYSILVLDGEHGVCESHALYALDVKARRENHFHFRGQLQRRLSEDELALAELGEADELQDFELVPVCGSFDFHLRCGSLMFLRK